MKSIESSNSEEKIKKATEALQKFWWFLFYLIIAPLTIAVVGFVIFDLFPWGHNFPLPLSVLTFMFALLFFYKSFDKYRNNPFFLNKKNNPVARIHILFLISILALIVTPIFIIISREPYSFILLPLISFSLLYNIVYYYYYFQPIAFYSGAEEQFKHPINFKLMAKQLYNLVIIFNYIIHIIFLSLTASFYLSWLFALITNIIFYFIALMSTKEQRREIKNRIRERQSFLQHLTIFKQEFVNSIVSLIFMLLIQLPLVVIITLSLSGVRFSSLDLINNAFLITIFILTYLKSRFYISFHYTALTGIYSNSQNKDNTLNKVKYQKQNVFLNGFIIGFISIFAFLINFSYLVLIILPFLYILFYYEQKSKFCPKRYNKYVLLLNTIAILSSISFGVLQIFLLNIQLIVFLISLYFVLQVFVKFDYFLKENVIIYQNLLAVASFCSIAYSFYSTIISEYAKFTTDPLIIFISNFLLNAVIVSIVSLISFYILYVRYFRENRSDLFRKCVMINIFLIELFIFIFINLRLYFLVEITAFIEGLILSSILFPVIFIFFSGVNHVLGVFPLKYFLTLSYFSIWILIFEIFLALFFNFLFNVYFIILMLDFLFLSIFSHLNCKFGVKLEKLSAEKFKKFVGVNSYFITIELFTLFFFFFNSIVFIELLIYHNLTLSTYISLVIITILINLLSWKEIVFSEAICMRFNIITLISSAALAFYYSFLFTFNTFYVFLTPFLILFGILFLPFYYMVRKKLYEKIVPKLLIADYVLIAIFLSLIPTIISLERFKLGLSIDIISVINFTLYIIFGILTLTYILSRIYALKENFKNSILKSLVLIEVILTGTTIFYYPFILLSGTYYSILIPLIAASCFFYLPSVFSYKKQLFNSDLMKKSILGNIWLLTGLVMSIPTIIALELIRMGFLIDIILVIMTTLLLFFVFLKLLDLFGKFLELKEKSIKTIKLIQIFTWLSISVFIIIEIASFLIIELAISSAFFIFFSLNFYTLKMLYDYSRELRFLSYLREGMLYGITLSISFLLVSFIRFSDILNLLPSPIIYFNELWYLGLIFLIALLLIRLSSSLIKIEYTKLNDGLEFVLWSVVKISSCLFISFLFSYSIFYMIFLFLLIFTILTPITLIYFKNLRLFSEENQLNIKKIILILYLISLLSLYGALFYSITLQVSFFHDNPIIHLTLITSNLILLSYYCLLRFNKVLELYTEVQYYTFYIFSSILFLSLLYFNFILSVFLFFSSLVLILSKRSIILIFRFVSYFLLSYVIFVQILAIFNIFELFTSFDLTSIGFFTSLYLLTLITVLFFSILLNLNKNNNLEKFSLYSILSTLSFVFLNTFTTILLLYNITISLFIFLFFVGIFFYRQKDERYKWFIKPCVLLLIFDVISFLSYSVLFNQPTYIRFSPILSFTFTMSTTGFGFVLLYNEAPVRFRKISFFIILTSIILCFPTFLYFFIVSSFSIPFADPIPIIVAINTAVFIFYLSVGIYHWKISWAIWKSGWYAWNVLPFANFYIIYKSLTGIDVLTNSLDVFGIVDLNGSLILALIICSLFFLPVLYTKIKQYFFQIVFLVWGESLFLLYWISQNLFVQDLLLRNLSFTLFSVILLMPIFAGLRFWRIVATIWLGITTINVSFLLFYLVSIGISLEIDVSINISVIGLFLIVYSFFPKIKSKGIILITAYFIMLTGIFLTTYFVLYAIILNPIFSINIAFIVIGFSLFSSKYIKLYKRIIDLCLSWILIFNFSWLTFNTFSLFPGLTFFAFFLAMTVFGISFFVFNHYKMKIPINKLIPYLTVAIGTSSSITSFVSILVKVSPGILITVFSTVLLIFLYFLLVDYRYLLWFFIPIPITLPLLELLLFIEVVRPLWFLSLSIIYLTIFQILINIFKASGKEKEPEIKNSLMRLFQDKNQIKLLNFTSFLLNSISFSGFISILLPSLMKRFLFNQIMVVYQVLDFLIIFPIFLLLCIKYIETSGLDLKLKDLLLYFNKISIVLYLIIPIALASNLLLFLLYIQVEFIISTILFFLTVSGVIFFESFIIDRTIFYYLLNSVRNKFTFYSWCVFCNLSCIFFYFLHFNGFLLMLSFSLLNLISLYFLSYLDISREKISTYLLILIYNSFIWGSFYIASLISNGMIILFDELEGIPYYLLLFQNSSLFLLVLSYFFVKVEKRVKAWIETFFVTSFQIFLGANWMIILIIFNILSFFTINLIILIELGLSFISVRYFNFLFMEKKHPAFLTKFYSILMLALYIEISLLIFGLFIQYFDVFGSLLVSLLVLFLLLSLDILFVNKIEKKYGMLIHALSYFTISLIILLILNRFIEKFQILMSLQVLIFMLMQFYTNHSVFATLRQFNPKKTEALDKWKAYLHHSIGAIFYSAIFYSLLQVQILLGIDYLFIFLSLSFLVHLIMILDKYLLKFLGKASDYIRVISWIFIMIFTAINLSWFYFTYIFVFIITVVPIIILFLILEIAYLVKLLEFWQFIISKKEKIRNTLLLAVYLNFMTWPLYYARLDALYLLSLMTGSFGIMLVLTYFDEYIGVFTEKRLRILQKISLTMVGVFISIDLFMIFEFILNLSLTFNLSIVLLVLVAFLIVIIQPFRRHPIIGFTFWAVIFTLLSSIIYHLSLSFVISGVILAITILTYPFIFLLEELRELFNKFIDILIRMFSKLKQLITRAIKSIFRFLKTYFKFIWIPFSALIAIFLGLSLSPIYLNYLNWIHSSLAIFAIFGLLYLLIPSEKSSDPDIIFKERMRSLIIGWGSVIAILFIFITPVWYLFTIFISIFIIGTITSIFLGRKEKREKISVKWRFYTLLTLILAFILFGILFLLQVVFIL